jgi:HSP20 family protein
MRSLIRWQPLNDLSTWNRGMDRLFNEFMGRSLHQMADETSASGSWSPAVNILEKHEGIVITADLPGLRSEDVDVTVDNGVLTIRGQRNFEEASEGETYHRVERWYGSFERSFSIPNSVDPSKIEARFVNGEMTVTLPKREESKPRSVKVKIATS